MRIAFDGRMAFHSGIGAHIRGLLRTMNHMSHPPNLTLLGDLNQLTSQDFHQNFQVKSYTAPIYSPWRQYWFPRRLDRIDALHVPHYNVPYRYQDPLIVTIHDLIHLLFPQNAPSKRFYARYTFRHIARTASLIFCVSEHTRSDVMERLGIESDRLCVLPNAVDPAFQPTSEPETLEGFRHEQGLPEQYLLSVGINKPHKNVGFLLRTLYPLWHDGQISMPLVVAGCGVDKTHFLQSVNALDVDKWVIMADWIDHRQMPLLYQGATALVMPSLYEGFGLPVLEAQRVGTPVIASNAASLPEVAGAGAVFFDPQDVEACADAILQVLSDSALRERLVEAGRLNEAQYSWEKSARLLLDGYASLT